MWSFRDITNPSSSATATITLSTPWAFVCSQLTTTRMIPHGMARWEWRTIRRANLRRAFPIDLSCGRATNTRESISPYGRPPLGAPSAQQGVCPPVL